jgi:hypothetical protein
MWNLDYPMQMMGNCQAEAVAAWRDMECAYPHWDKMAEEGIIIHDALQEKHYEHASYMVQKMDLLEETKFFEISMGYIHFLFDPTGEYTNQDIQKYLWSMDTFADAFEYVANALDEGTLIFEPTGEFMAKMTGMELENVDEVDEATYMQLVANFEAMSPSNDDLRNYAEQMRNFMPSELTHEQIDDRLNMQCNKHFGMFLDYHNAQVSKEVAMFQEYKAHTFIFIKITFNHCSVSVNPLILFHNKVLSMSFIFLEHSNFFRYLSIMIV